MPDVWFIRHGECTANIGGATRTAEEAPLTARGEQQAKLVADYLLATARIDLSRIISSHYRRALDTAAPTRKYFNEAPFETYLPVHEFTYLAFPSSAFTTSQQRSPYVKEYWKRCSPSYSDRDTAESFKGFIGRVQGALDSLRNYENDRLIVVFSHHQFMQAVRWLLQPGREIQASQLQSGEMSDFYEFLNTAAISNGAILKTRLCQGTRFDLRNIVTEYLTARMQEEALFSVAGAAD